MPDCSVPAATPVPCAGACQGSGYVTGPASICGDYPVDPCDTCGGSGTMPTAEEIAALRRERDVARTDLDVARQEQRLLLDHLKAHGLGHPWDAHPDGEVEDENGHRWVGAGEYGDTTHGHMCGDCGVDLEDAEDGERCPAHPHGGVHTPASGAGYDANDPAEVVAGIVWDAIRGMPVAPTDHPDAETYRAEFAARRIVEAIGAPSHPDGGVHTPASGEVGGDPPQGSEDTHDGVCSRCGMRRWKCDGSTLRISRMFSMPLSLACEVEAALTSGHDLTAEERADSKEGRR